DKYTAVMVWDKPSAIYHGLFEAVRLNYMLEVKDIVKYDGYNRSLVGTGPFIFVVGKSVVCVWVDMDVDYCCGMEYVFSDVTACSRARSRSRTPSRPRPARTTTRT